MSVQIKTFSIITSKSLCYEDMFLVLEYSCSTVIASIRVGGKCSNLKSHRRLYKLCVKTTIIKDGVFFCALQLHLWGGGCCLATALHSVQPRLCLVLQTLLTYSIAVGFEALKSWRFHPNNKWEMFTCGVSVLTCEQVLAANLNSPWLRWIQFALRPKNSTDVSPTQDGARVIKLISNTRGKLPRRCLLHIPDVLLMEVGFEACGGVGGIVGK